MLRVWTHAQLNNVMLSAHMMGQVSQGLGEREREGRGDVLSCKDIVWNKSTTVSPYRGT